MILQEVRRLVHPPLDSEDLAVQIWIHCAEEGIRPCRKVIRWKVHDFLRHHRLDKKVLEGWARTRPQGKVDLKDLVGVLVDSTPLTFQQRRLLWERFYMNREIKDLAEMWGVTEKTMGLRVQALLESLRATARRLGLGLEDL